MAITNAQQYQQLVNKPAGNKRPGYAGADLGDNKGYQGGGRDKKGSVKGAAPGAATVGPVERGGGNKNPNEETGGNKRTAPVSQVSKITETKDKRNIVKDYIKNRQELAFNASMLIPGQKKRSAKYQKAYKDYLESMGVTPPDTLTGEEDDLADFFINNAFDKPVAADANVQPPQSYGDFLLENFGAPGVKFSGNVGGKEVYVKGTRPDGSKIYDVREERGGGRDDFILPISQPVASIPEPTGYVNPLSLLTPRIAGTRFLGTELEDEEDTEFAADGGRIGFFKGAVAGGGNISPGTGVKGNVRDDNPFTGGGGDGPKTTPIVNPVGSNEPAVNPIFRKTLREPELQLEAFIKKMELEDRMKEEDDEEKNLQEILAGTITNQPEFQSNIDATISGIMDNPDLAALGTIKQGMAEGGRAELAGGGMPYEGGIMDLESGRQMYFLGKLVKKATRAIKKITKSPIGKAALLGGLGYLGATKMGGMKGLSSFFGKGSFNPLKALITKGPQAGKMGGSELGNLLAKFGLAKEGSLTGKGMLTLGAGVLPFLAGKEEDGFDIDAYYAANQLTPGTTKRQMGSEFDFYNYNLAEGGMPSKEPVAKKTMPLLDMDGQEMDLRAEGGFVPLGRMERADDVPARLSKNEFVFTADAVRNAGEGDIDKGAEVMYNMMKNLESGGEVSEESQGLDGAREMFQTSKRLEEVL